MRNPCLDCGACCAFYRVTFHWSEAEAALGGATPAELTNKLTPHHVAMRGTESPSPRCDRARGAHGLPPLEPPRTPRGRRRRSKGV